MISEKLNGDCHVPDDHVNLTVCMTLCMYIMVLVNSKSLKYRKLLSYHERTTWTLQSCMCMIMAKLCNERSEWISELIMSPITINWTSHKNLIMRHCRVLQSAGQFTMHPCTTVYAKTWQIRWLWNVLHDQRLQTTNDARNRFIYVCVKLNYNLTCADSAVSINATPKCDMI